MFIIGVLLLAIVFILIIVGLERGKNPNKKNSASENQTTQSSGIDKNSKPGHPV